MLLLLLVSSQSWRVRTQRQKSGWRQRRARAVLVADDEGKSDTPMRRTAPPAVDVGTLRVPGTVAVLVGAVLVGRPERTGVVVIAATEIGVDDEDEEGMKMMPKTEEDMDVQNVA